ncbi:hypothetical protein FHX61_003907 [Cupriavidus alkaliphilus]|uniref:Uncharacterized protein n=1 Tax=Cupriavidus alkaliphilus TaxID=942866 RepID=A0A7W4VDD9_9BURK|nr:hypothetical protein [Cupriavidus alkaliphilus]
MLILSLVLLAMAGLAAFVMASAAQDWRDEHV